MYKKIKSTIITLIIISTTILFSCTPKEISMFDYVHPKFSGENGNGKIILDGDEFLKFQQAVLAQYVPEDELKIWKHHIKTWGRSDDMEIDPTTAHNLDIIQKKIDEADVFKYYELIPKESVENLKNGDKIEVGIKKKDGIETDKINVKEEIRTFTVEGLK